MIFPCVLTYPLVHINRLWKSTFDNIIGGSYRLYWKSTFDNIAYGSFRLYQLLIDGIMNLLIQYSQPQNTPDADVT